MGSGATQFGKITVRTTADLGLAIGAGAVGSIDLGLLQGVWEREAPHDTDLLSLLALTDHNTVARQALAKLLQDPARRNYWSMARGQLGHLRRFAPSPVIRQEVTAVLRERRETVAYVGISLSVDGSISQGGGEISAPAIYFKNGRPGPDPRVSDEELIRVLETVGGNQTQAGEILGLSGQQISKRLRRRGAHPSLRKFLTTKGQKRRVPLASLENLRRHGQKIPAPSNGTSAPSTPSIGDRGSIATPGSLLWELDRALEEMDRRPPSRGSRSKR